MKSDLMKTATDFIRSKKRYSSCLYCSNGIKQAFFERKHKNYLILKIKQYKGANIYPEIICSIGTPYPIDIIKEIEHELNLI